MSKLKSNLVYLTFAQAISYIFPLLTLPYLSHKLDPSDFGMLGVCQAIVQYFIIVT
ncbi:oligosaccharide flippase family protein, partial [Escherichia coli]|nr:oligosaccharide flippase family protein [Escherichia coli]